MLSAGHDRKYALTLLAVAAAILAAGILVRAARTAQKKPAVDLERLQQLTEQRRLRDLSGYFINAANRFAASLVYLDPPGSSGVVWGSRDEILAPRKGAVPFELAPARQADAVVPAFRAASPPQPGEWVMAVARNRDGQIVLANGLYQGQSASHCGSFVYDEIESGVPFSDALVGGGLFTLDGQLLGFIARCGERAVVIGTSTIADVLAKPVPLSDRLEMDWGMRLNTAGAGLQVTAIWAHSPAAAAGLQPGDLVRTLDNSTVDALADLQPLEPAAASGHDLGIQRGARNLTLRLVPLPASITAAIGLTLRDEAADGAVAVLSVTPDSPAQRAGILPGDRIRLVGTDATQGAAAAARALDNLNGKPAVLSLERDGKELEVLLTP